MLAPLLLLAQAPAQIPPQLQFTRESCNFGSIVSSAGDFDKDGVPDFLIGEDRNDRLDCWVLSGKDNRRLALIRARWLAKGTTQALPVPDIDGDEFPDFVACHRAFDSPEPAELALLSALRARALT